MEIFLPAITFLIILIVLFLIFRNVICWFWKINESVAVLKEIRDLLRQQQSSAPKVLTPAVQGSGPQQPDPGGNIWICSCGNLNEVDPRKNIQNCKQCGLNYDFVKGKRAA